MKRAILVIDVQRVYTNPESPLFCDMNEVTITKITAIVARGYRKAI